MSKNNAEKAFLEAAEIAKKLPNNLQETGFTRALDRLQGSQSPASKSTSSLAPRDRATSSRETSNQRRPRAHELLDAIDRTLYPLSATRRVADRALKVLHLAHQDPGMGGLTTAEIADILTRKFRLGCTEDFPGGFSGRSLASTAPVATLPNLQRA